MALIVTNDHRDSQIIQLTYKNDSNAQNTTHSKFWTVYIILYTIHHLCDIQEARKQQGCERKGCISYIVGLYHIFKHQVYMNLLYPKLLIFFVKREICDKNVNNRCNHSLLCPINE